MSVEQEGGTMERFVGLPDFLDFLQRRPQSTDLKLIDHKAQEIRRCGKVFSRRFGSLDVVVRGANYREDITMMGAPCRGFALLEALDSELGTDSHAAILCCDDSEVVAQLFRRAYPNTVSAASAETVRPHPDHPRFAVDVCAMGFGDDSFRALVYSETLSPSPDLPLALSEAARVLRQGGVMLATFPFACLSANAGNSGGALDWSILEASRDAGFAAVDMLYLSNPTAGIIGADTDGIFILRCRA